MTDDRNFAEQFRKLIRCYRLSPQASALQFQRILALRQHAPPQGLPMRDPPKIHRKQVPLR